MARNITARLQQLRSRRRGIDRVGRLNEQARLEVLAKSFADESWQQRAGNQQYTRYALGSMQEVGPEYTRISVETAERVGRQLNATLSAEGFRLNFRLQGSVPLNVHIRGVSDVDLLSLDAEFFTYETAGPRSRQGLYAPSPKTSIEVLRSLRSAAERTLKAKFPAATVDTTGGKAINISGGSLARPVDVVPSHWLDTVAYQTTNQEYERGVVILDTKTFGAIDNFPFLHMKSITNRDLITNGGLKKSIRLCKNVKNDAEEEGVSISLPSFDIAATMYHADLASLQKGDVYELAVLAEAQRHLDALARNHEHAQSLLVPDGSRRIFDTPEKLRGLNQLSYELDDLAREVAKEQNSYLAKIAEPPLDASRAILSTSFIR